MLAGADGSVEYSCFIKIGDCGGEEKDDDVDPIGRFSDNAVISVEEDGNEGESQQNASELDAPKISSFPKKATFHDGKQEHGPKEKLHVLPG